jgi:hypothetical protein
MEISFRYRDKGPGLPYRAGASLTCLPVRAILLSHVYLDPANRGKLRALASQGCSITAAVPGGIVGEDGGVRLAPIPVSGDANGRPPAVESPLRRFSTTSGRCGQIEEEPSSPAAAVTPATRHTGGALQLGEPARHRLLGTPPDIPAPCRQGRHRQRATAALLRDGLGTQRSSPSTGPCPPPPIAHPTIGLAIHSSAASSRTRCGRPPPGLRHDMGHGRSPWPVPAPAGTGRGPALRLASASGGWVG